MVLSQEIVTVRNGHQTRDALDLALAGSWHRISASNHCRFLPSCLREVPSEQKELPPVPVSLVNLHSCFCSTPTCSAAPLSEKGAHQAGLGVQPPDGVLPLMHSFTQLTAV